MGAKVGSGSDGRGALSLKWELLHVPVILTTLLVGVVGYAGMPEQIPLHVGFDGTVDSWAEKGVWAVLVMPAIQLFLAACFAVSHWVLVRFARDEGSAAGAVTARVRGELARAQSAFLLVAGLLVNLGFILFQFAFLGAVGLGVAGGVMGAIAAAVVVGCIVLGVHCGKVGARAAKEAGDAAAQEDERHWRLGMVYVNPDDPRAFVPERLGMGWTLNLAHPVGKVLCGVLVLVVVAALVFVAVSL